MPREVWIGLVNLIPGGGNKDLEGAKGAYVNILAFAENEEDYRNLVKFAAYEHNYSIRKIKDVESFATRIKNYEIDEALLKLSKKVQETGKTHFGEFFVYENEE